MMRCLCCGKEIGDNASAEEKNAQWHNKCIHKFFGTSRMPSIDVSERELEKIADTAVSRGLTVPGVQKKISLHLSMNEGNRLTIVDYPTGYILKPQTKEFRCLPEFEHMVMQMADLSKVRTVPHALIKIGKEERTELAYITRRIDRRLTYRRGKTVKIEKYAMEDFCQLNYRITADKYKGSYEQCAKTIKKYSARPLLDLSELFLRLVFCFIVGNSDMHLKNFSLIEDNPGSRSFGLSAAYDLLPVNVVMPEDKEQFALTLNGKKRNIHRNDFLKYAKTIEYPDKAAGNLIRRLCADKDLFLKCIDTSFLPEDLKEEMRIMIDERSAVLTS